jgi:hypothetical protein
MNVYARRKVTGCFWGGDQYSKSEGKVDLFLHSSLVCIVCSDLRRCKVDNIDAFIVHCLNRVPVCKQLVRHALVTTKQKSFTNIDEGSTASDIQVPTAT